MANEENLIRFKKGQSGNPNGRPKLPDLREIMAEVLSEEKDGRTALKAIVMKLRQMAVAGNIKAADILMSRGYGLPKDIKQITINSEPVILNWTDDQPNSEAEGSEEAAG